MVGPIELLLVPVGAVTMAAAVADGPTADDAATTNVRLGHYHDSEIHLAVVAGSNEASDDMDQWVEALDAPKEREGRQQ